MYKLEIDGVVLPQEYERLEEIMPWVDVFVPKKDIKQVSVWYNGCLWDCFK